MRQIDLNADLGESFGPYQLGSDKDVLSLITSANVACGFHAGDPRIMDETVHNAVIAKTALGAHPGYPDKVGFGRRAMGCTPREVETDVLYQIGALGAFCRSRGVSLQHVKAHGALHHAAVAHLDIARAIATAVSRYDTQLLFVVLPGTYLEQAGREKGLRLAFEGYVDRAYNPDGTLVSRKLPGAVLDNPEQAAERAIKMIKDHYVEANDGSRVEFKVDTLCVHGDNPRAVEFLQAVHALCHSEGIALAPMAAVIGQ